MASVYRISTPCLLLKSPNSSIWSIQCNQIFKTSSSMKSPSTTTLNNVLSKNCSTLKNPSLTKTGTTALIGLSFTTAPNQSGSGYSNIFDIKMKNTNENLNLNLSHRRFHKHQDQQLRNYSSLHRPLASKIAQDRNTNQQQLINNKENVGMANSNHRRFISTKEITKNLTLYTANHFKSQVDKKTLEFKPPTGNALVLMMSWLMAKPKHLKKYAELYTEMGFDVMVIHITPWQLLWPVKGSQIVAAEALKFLENNKTYAPIVLHGFSVGGYQFGEIMLQMSRDMERYKPILDRFVCQIWDSAADITEIPEGLPRAIFPKNPRMQTALRNYTLYHLKTFHNQATIHYMRSSQMFHSTLVKCPALFFVSDNDPIGPPSSNNTVRENWERGGVEVTFKCWPRSQHAAHFIKHRDEYLELLFKHLEKSNSLENISLKSRAKL